MKNLYNTCIKSTGFIESVTKSPSSSTSVQVWSISPCWSNWRSRSHSVASTIFSTSPSPSPSTSLSLSLSRYLSVCLSPHMQKNCSPWVAPLHSRLDFCVYDPPQTVRFLRLGFWGRRENGSKRAAFFIMAIRHIYRWLPQSNKYRWVRPDMLDFFGFVCRCLVSMHMHV